ncbi:MAG: exodeoxyribonuclease VII large subunit [Clostridia bacterium]|nr:exodeoxyribonuclease VII large subunit [Clostridia bacterium]
MKDTFTITEINEYIRNRLESDGVLGNIWLKGEISNFKAHSSGHLYFTLKDENSVLRAVMFKGAASTLLFKPEDGMKVLARCSVRVYIAGGSYQAYVTEMKVDGVGDLHVAFEQLKAKLAQEGFFDQTRKKPLPRFPARIGIVTSPTGAAIRDMLNILSRRSKYPEIFIYPTLVQGPDAPPQIIEGIRYFNLSDSVDVIITGRGGGSIEDLWAFNDEGVAREIAASHIPVISAVGHEIDFTIADFVADLRAATPSEAAERVAPDDVETKARLETAMDKLIAGLRNNVTEKRGLVQSLNMERVFKGLEKGIEDRRLKTDQLADDLIRATELNLERKAQQLKMAAAGLDALSPLAVLSRGYSIAFGKEGKPLKSVKDVEMGDNITIKLGDGEVGAEVTNK